MIGYIYKTTNTINGKVYIGKKEKSEYDPSYYGSGKLINRAINKYGKENFTNEILDTAETIEELNKKEIYHISICKEKLKNKCYNIAEGGTGGNVIKYMSPEERKDFSNKMRKINKQRCSSEEFKSKISKATKERYANNDEREKQSLLLKKVWSDESLLKKHSEIQKKRFEDPIQRAKQISYVKGRWLKAGAREHFKKVMEEVWTEEKREKQSKLLKSKTTIEKRLSTSERSKELWKNPSHREHMSKRIREVRLTEDINKGAEARKIKILLIHNEKEILFNSRVEFEQYCIEVYGFAFSNKTYKKLIETGEPFKSYYKKQNHMNGIILKTN